MCGKKLTDPESIQRGFGPTCWAEMHPKRKIRTVDDEPEIIHIPGQMEPDDPGSHGIGKGAHLQLGVVRRPHGRKRSGCVGRADAGVLAPDRRTDHGTGFRHAGISESRHA